MPEIKIQHVVSCSSEDKNNPADNLLLPEGTHKWKSATAGEKSVSIVLQFEKASQVHSLDIGNEGSAFVEVLVGRSSATSDQDYKVLLVASTFMSPQEARNGTNRNSVRMFGTSNLTATVVSEKWDRVKIVCTQPFNKTSTYGLSFIKFHSPPDPSEKAVPKTIGFFKMKTEGNGDVKAGGLFAHRDKVEQSPPVTGAAAIRAASKLSEGSKPVASTSSSSTPVKPVASSSSTPAKKETKPESVQKKKVEAVAPSPKDNREKRKHKVSDDEDTEDESTPALRKQSTSVSSVASRASSHGEKHPPMKKTKSEPPKASAEKQFGRIMEKVVFVMSGFQNPYRGELRDRAMAMGATYKPDWGRGCTHLICAFVNTPKYKQVEGRGKIVDKKWIQDCYKQKKLLPWRKYRLGDAESPSEDSDDEYVPAAKASPVKHKHSDKKPAKKPPVKSTYPQDSDDDMYGGDTDSGDDTEDEIRRIRQAEKKKPSPAKAGGGKVTEKSGGGDEEEDPYGQDTDEDTGTAPGPSGGGDSDDGADSGLPELPDFFADKQFFIYGDMKAADRRILNRYITAFDGELEEYMSEKINYVITSAKWDNNFDDALSDNPNLVFVKPKWVHMCHEKNKLLPHQPYIVVPDS